jgi:hypothetical protein
MNSRNENKLSMAKAVLEALNTNNPIVATIPAFGSAKTELTTVINQIDSLVQTQTRKVTAGDKTIAMNKAVDAAAAIIGVAKAYAMDQNKPSLIASFSYTRTELVKMRDTVLSNTLTLIHDNALAIVTQLADYGITATQLSELKTLADDYAALLSTPRANITAKSTATKALVPAFENMEIILAKLDGFAEGKRNSHKDFYNVYQSSRKL